ncbi:MAG: leucyl/phenylalanyl-tRNA--protein transferase [Balneolales bacterium]
MSIVSPEVLLSGYMQGIFPMARSRHDTEVNWFTAGRRGVIPMDRFHVSGKVQRIIRRKAYRWAINSDFTGVMEACADRESTWISDRLIASFAILHQLGYAHSVEVYREKRLVGGVYGVSLQSAFFAESMFHRESEMGKVALYHCFERLKERGFYLWDTQFYTPHLGQFGCVEIDSAEYDYQLEEALKRPAKFDG